MGLVTTIAGVIVIVVCLKLRTSEKYFQSTWSTQPRILRDLGVVPNDPKQFRAGLRGALIGGVVGGLLLILIGVASIVVGFR